MPNVVSGSPLASAYLALQNKEVLYSHRVRLIVGVL